MIKQIAWNTFKKTGNINTFMELKQFEDVFKNTSGQQESLGNISNLDTKNNN